MNIRHHLDAQDASNQFHPGGGQLLYKILGQIMCPPHTICPILTIEVHHELGGGYYLHWYNPKFYYTNGYVQISMPGYVRVYLSKYK